MGVPEEKVEAAEMALHRAIESLAELYAEDKHLGEDAKRIADVLSEEVQERVFLKVLAVIYPEEPTP